MIDDTEYLLAEIGKTKEPSIKNDDTPLNKADGAALSHDEKAQLAKYLKRAAADLNLVAEKLVKAAPEQQNSFLYEALSIVAKAQLPIRNGIDNAKEYRLFDSPQGFVEPVKVTAVPVEHGIVRLLLPPLVSQKYAGGYNIYLATKAAMEKFKNEHGLEDVIGKKLVLMYRRFTTDFDTSTMLDNDNWECKRVTNAIAEVLQYSDSIDHFSMVYTTSRSTQNYIEATLANADFLTFFT